MLTEANAPAFMRPAFPITEADKARLAPCMKSWMSMAHTLKTASELDILKMLVLELNGRRKPIIIGRCLGRFRTKRAQREDGEL